ncbi:MAG: alpha/beta-hydrolase N-terminal domain-containing protein, partial [Streptosporangiaceae bacterium]
MPGVVLATVLFWQSLWPSLLPRTWLMQGVLSGLCLVVGYAVGAVLGSVFVSVWNALGIGRRVPPQVERRARFALAAVALVVTVYAFTRSAEQQEWNWTALGVDRPQGYRYGGVLLVTLLICAVALC